MIALVPGVKFGFQEILSTEQFVHRLSEAIYRGLNRRRICIALFLDVAEAFIKVW